VRDEEVLEEENDVKEILNIIRGHVLSAPVRLVISLVLLIREEVEFNELQKALGITPGALWSHILKMEKQGFIKMKRRLSTKGPRLVITLTEKGREETIRYVEVLRKLIGILNR